MVKTPPKKVFWGGFKAEVPSKEVFGPLGYISFLFIFPYFSYYVNLLFFLLVYNVSFLCLGVFAGLF